MAARRTGGKAKSKARATTRTARKPKARKAAPGRSRKVEIRNEVQGKERVTVVRKGSVTTRVDRGKLREAMKRLVDDPAARARLEANPLKEMAAMGIQISSKEAAALAGKRLSEVVARIAGLGTGAASLGFFPQSVIDVVVEVLSPGPTAQITAETATSATTEVTGEVTAAAAVTTGAEETAAVVAFTL